MLIKMSATDLELRGNGKKSLFDADYYAAMR
jgi:hypothetical protein